MGTALWGFTKKSILAFSLVKTLDRDKMSDFKENVFKFIKEIPEGKVATYGQIAMLAGSHRAARQVGMLLNGSSKHDPNNEIPWQRVINSQGGISTHKIGSGELQRDRRQRRFL